MESVVTQDTQATKQNEEMVDAGGEALRQRMQGGKNIRAWDNLPNSAKKKWREYSALVLHAAGILAPREY
jgi:hypothetical protein